MTCRNGSHYECGKCRAPWKDTCLERGMTDEELRRAYENAVRCGSSDAVWMRDEIDARLEKAKQC